MIITRSPLLVSFAGGGTDIPAFYRKYGPGVVVSTAINRYVYVTVDQKFDGKVSVRYRIHEMVDRVSELRHPLIRECILAFGIQDGIEIVISSEVPARGSGLGASSALACALCQALSKYTGQDLLQKQELAEIAARIEIFNVGSPIGKQDHYASAMGGLNLIRFNSDNSVEVEKYIADDFSKEIEGQSMLFYLNIEHEYHETADQGGHGQNFVQKILKDQVAEVDEKSATHILQRDNAVSLWENIDYGVPERFIDHVNENWRIKRTVHSDISNPRIDGFVAKAYAAGATAAKVCGAGGGGFLYLMVPPSMQDSVRAALSQLHELKFGFDWEGTKCLFEDKVNYAADIR